MLNKIRSVRPALIVLGTSLMFLIGIYVYTLISPGLANSDLDDQSNLSEFTKIVKGEKKQIDISRFMYTQELPAIQFDQVKLSAWIDEGSMLHIVAQKPGLTKVVLQMTDSQGISSEIAFPFEIIDADLPGSVAESDTNAYTATLKQELMAKQELINEQRRQEEEQRQEQQLQEKLERQREELELEQRREEELALQQERDREEELVRLQEIARMQEQIRKDQLAREQELERQEKLEARQKALARQQEIQRQQMLKRQQELEEQRRLESETLALKGISEQDALAEKIEKKINLFEILEEEFRFEGERPEWSFDVISHDPSICYAVIDRDGHTLILTPYSPDASTIVNVTAKHKSHRTKNYQLQCITDGIGRKNRRSYRIIGLEKYE